MDLKVEDMKKQELIDSLKRLKAALLTTEQVFERNRVETQELIEFGACPLQFATQVGNAVSHLGGDLAGKYIAESWLDHVK